jgi:hypothetical protein
MMMIHHYSRGRALRVTTSARKSVRPLVTSSVFQPIAADCVIGKQSLERLYGISIEYGGDSLHSDWLLVRGGVRLLDVIKYLHNVMLFRALSVALLRTAQRTRTHPRVLVPPECLEGAFDRVECPGGTPLLWSMDYYS